MHRFLLPLLLLVSWDAASSAPVVWEAGDSHFHLCELGLQPLSTPVPSCDLVGGSISDAAGLASLTGRADDANLGTAAELLERRSLIPSIPLYRLYCVLRR
jgi:hypothetical protein